MSNSHKTMSQGGLVLSALCYHTVASTHHLHFTHNTIFSQITGINMHLSNKLFGPKIFPTINTSVIYWTTYLFEKTRLLAKLKISHASVTHTRRRVPTSLLAEYLAQCVSRAELGVQAACVGRGGGSSVRLITSPLIAGMERGRNRYLPHLFLD